MSPSLHTSNGKAQLSKAVSEMLTKGPFVDVASLYWFLKSSLQFEASSVSFMEIHLQETQCQNPSLPVCRLQLFSDSHFPLQKGGERYGRKSALDAFQSSITYHKSRAFASSFTVKSKVGESTFPNRQPPL